MPTFELISKYSKNKGLVMSPFELLSLYLYGIDTKAKDGSLIKESDYEFYIRAAQDEVEKAWDIKMTRCVIEEERDFARSDFEAFGFIDTIYPVNDVISLSGYYGSQKMVEYPKDWLSIRNVSRVVSSSAREIEGVPDRKVNIVPGSSSYSPVLQSGIAVPFFGLRGASSVPNYWTLMYCTGFKSPPADLVNFIGKLASTNIFNLLGDLILGAGIASQSIGIDGLSQSITTTSSAENSGYSSRIKQYLSEIKAAAPKLKSYYVGIRAAIA